MLPDSLTAKQLRMKREDLKTQQEIKKLKKEISEKTRELRRIRTSSDRSRNANNRQRISLAQRQQVVYNEWKTGLQKLPYDDRNMEYYRTTLEEEAVKMKLGTFEEQQERMNEEEKMQFEVLVLQEIQLIRQMQLMHVTGQQRYLCKKHDQQEIEYLRDCEKWLDDDTGLLDAIHKLQQSMKDMTQLYQETLRMQEAGLAKVDADMTIRESIEDIF
jgi:hypothetical protein